MQISAISSAYSSPYAPHLHVGAGQNLPAAGNSSPARQANAAGASRTEERAGDSVTASEAYALASQVAGEYASFSKAGSSNDEQSAQLSGRAAASAAGLASTGGTITMPEVTAAVRSYMNMHAAANPQVKSVLLVA